MPTPLRIVKPKPTSDVNEFLRSGGAGTTIVAYRPREVVFSQGDAADSVMYVQDGTVKLSVLSRCGQEAVVAMLESGAFFAERALLGDPVRHDVATAMTEATVLIIPTEQMVRLLNTQQAFSDRFRMHTLARNIRLEEDMVDQLLHSSEKRLARALLLWANAGRASKRHRVRPRLSQQTLAEMVGTTRSRVSFFMNRFKQRGYIEYSGGLTVNDSLATVILGGEGVRVRPSKTG